MKQIMKYVSKILLLIVMVFSINLISNSITTNAANNYTLNLNDTFVKGTITSGDTVNYYYITLPSDGWIYITYQGWSVGNSCCTLYNSDMSDYYFREMVYTSSDSSPITVSDNYALGAGTYILKINSNMDRTGDYKVKGRFVAAGNNESEPNNYYSNAMSLSENEQVTGFITTDDPLDIYKINVPTATTIRITYISRIEKTYLTTYNSDCVQEYNEAIYTASEDNPLTKTVDQYCQAGTNYIKVSQYFPSSALTGRYQIKWSIPSDDNTVDSSSSVSKVTSVKVKAKSNKKVKVSWKKQSNVSKYEIQISTNKKFKKNLVTKKVASSKKAVTIKSKKKGTAYVRVRAISTSGSKGSWSKTVKVKVK